MSGFLASSSPKAWWEAVAAWSTALVLLALLPWCRPQDAGDEGRALWQGLPARIEVRFGTHHYQLWFQRDGDLIADADGQPLARLWSIEAAQLRRTLGTLRQLRRIARPGELSRYGLDEALVLVHGGRDYLLGSVGDGRGYLRDGKGVVILDQDLAALLTRPPAALRAPTLDLPKEGAVQHSRGWSLRPGQGRDWWRPQDETEARWTDAQTVAAWRRSLGEAPVLGWAPEQPEALVRAELRIQTDTRQVVLADLGPAGEARLLRRSETIAGQRIAEYLLVEIDAALLDPPQDFFATRRLLPLDPLHADMVQLGQLQLHRSRDGRWRDEAGETLDQELVEQVLGTLARIPAATPSEPQTDPGTADETARGSAQPSLIVRHGTLEWQLREPEAVVAALLADLHPGALHERHVLPGTSPEDIQALVVAAADGTPDIWQREAGQPWAADEREDVEQLVAALCKARVELWRRATRAEQDASNWEATLTLAIGAQARSIRLRGNGTVLAVERGLIGRLDAASRRRLLGE